MFAKGEFWVPSFNFKSSVRFSWAGISQWVHSLVPRVLRQGRSWTGKALRFDLLPTVTVWLIPKEEWDPQTVQTLGIYDWISMSFLHLIFLRKSRKGSLPCSTAPSECLSLRSTLRMKLEKEMTEHLLWGSLTLGKKWVCGWQVREVWVAWGNKGHHTL